MGDPPADGSGQGVVRGRRVRRIRRRPRLEATSSVVRRLAGRRRSGPADLGYPNHVPADALAVVNLMSLFGLHRELRGAAIGHFASTEITSSPGSGRLVEALEPMGAPESCIGFDREHVEADAVHEQVVGPTWSVIWSHGNRFWIAMWVFGIRGRDLIEDRLATHLMERWTTGRRRYGERRADASGVRHRRRWLASHHGYALLRRHPQTAHHEAIGSRPRCRWVARRARDPAPSPARRVSPAPGAARGRSPFVRPDHQQLLIVLDCD